MKNNSNLLTEFNVRKKEKPVVDVKDYAVFSDKEKLDALRAKIVQNLINNKIPENITLEQYINDEIDDVLQDYDLGALERNHICNLIQNEINGYGPLTDLLNNDSVTEIMVNGTNDIYVEVDGKLVKDESVSFINEDHIIRTVQRIVQPLGRTIDAVNPMVDARLRDGSRLNAIIPPLSLTGPIVTIRKFSKRMNSIDDLLRMGTMTAHMALFLQACVRAKLNIIISGGTGTGKTTLLNILSGFIDDEERIITIEDAAELKLHQKHVVSLETRMVNYEGEGEITIRDLVRNSLRMRPDRIIVGEVRGKEAFDMLQAMNTGHEGSITTLHSNSPDDAINRLETMMLMNDMDLPVSAIRNYIEKAINIIVQIDRLSDGKRKVTSISEIVGFKDDKVNLKEIFSFKENGLSEHGYVRGEFVVYKHVPKVYDKIKRKGIVLDNIFGE
ncbi:MAG: CpaF family protein [Erysipelotrichaceae bacterium]|nr:CpaF family protein [Erysipelotrichaceae bacterium]MDD6093009.1 CpaF family protein [bacterium]MDY3934350.1 CpaF family protein [Bacilli bacterium]